MKPNKYPYSGKKESTLKVDSDKIATGITARNLAIHPLKYQALTVS